jgi:hypothetical protein
LEIYKTYEKIYFVQDFSKVNPWNHRKKVPPRHQSRYIGTTSDVVYRKLKGVVEASIIFAKGN